MKIIHSAITYLLKQLSSQFPNRRDCIIIDGLSTYNEMKLPYSNFCGNCGPFLRSATNVMTSDKPISICCKYYTLGQKI